MNRRKKENIHFTTRIKFQWTKPEEDREMKDVARLQMMFRLRESLLSFLSFGQKSSFLLQPVLITHEESQRTCDVIDSKALVLSQREERREQKGWIIICYR